MTYYKTAKEALENAEKDHGNFVEHFDGKNCDDCPGWTVGERRCDCGNRRVSWSTQETDKGWYVFAEAW